MNIGFFVIFIVAQVLVNYLLRFVLGSVLSTVFGVLAYCLLSALIISFIAAFLSTPRQLRRDFFRHPGFHKTMIIYFVIFVVFDLILNMRTIIALLQ